MILEIVEFAKQRCFEDISAQIRKCAETGKPISGRAIDLVKSMTLNEAQKAALIGYAKTGWRNQKMLGFPNEAEKYQHLIDTIS